MAQKINILQVDNSVAINLFRKVLLLTVDTIQKIEVAGTIAKAKEKLKGQTFDFAILDTNLPDGNGLELLGLIKKKHPSIIVILFTNDSDSFFRKTAEQLGVNYFLEKSTGFEKIIQILKKHSETNVQYSYSKIKKIVR